MSRSPSVLIIASVSLFTLGSASAMAASLAENQCTSFCGDAGVASFSKIGSDPNCVCNETTKDVKGNAFGTATQQEESGHGNLSPKTTGQDGGTTYPQKDCTGNQGQCKQQ
jgi:hypothetical protein